MDVSKRDRVWRDGDDETLDDDPLDNAHDDPLPEDGADHECIDCG